MSNTDLIQIISILIAIISIVVLIKFFTIANAVVKIKNQLCPGVEDYIIKAREESFIGDKEKSREFYLRARFKVESSYWDAAKKKKYLSNIDKELEAL